MQIGKSCLPKERVHIALHSCVITLLRKSLIKRNFITLYTLVCHCTCNILPSRMVHATFALVVSTIFHNLHYAKALNTVLFRDWCPLQLKKDRGGVGRTPGFGAMSG